MKKHYLVFPELMPFLYPSLIIKCIYHLYMPCNPLSPSSIVFMLVILIYFAGLTHSVLTTGDCSTT